MTYLVYKITRSDGQLYIGTTNTDRINYRMCHHSYSKRFKNYTFEYEVIYKSDDVKEIYEKEEYYIQKYDTFYNGLNNSINGRGNHLCDRFTTLGYKHKEETKKKISAKTKGKKAWNKGIGRSESTKNKISKKHKGRVPPNRKLTEEEVRDMLRDYYNNMPEYHNGIILKNGRESSYIHEFAKKYEEKYNVTIQCIKRIIKGDSWKSVYKEFQV